MQPVVGSGCGWKPAHSLGGLRSLGGVLSSPRWARSWLDHGRLEVARLRRSRCGGLTGEEQHAHNTDRQTDRQTDRRTDGSLCSLPPTAFVICCASCDASSYEMPCEPVCGSIFECKGFVCLVRVVVALNRCMLQLCLCPSSRIVCLSYGSA